MSLIVIQKKNWCTVSKVSFKSCYMIFKDKGFGKVIRNVAYQYILIQDVELVFVTYLSLFLFHELHYFFFFLMTDQFFINVILFYCYAFIRSCDTWHVVENFLSFHLRYYDFIDQLNCMKLKQK